MLQADLLNDNPGTIIRILGINNVGAESGNADTCAGRTIPWLQDVPWEDVYAAWPHVYRDVIIVDQNNVQIDVYNLTTKDLGVLANYNELKARLLAAAGE